MIDQDRYFAIRRGCIHLVAYYIGEPQPPFMPHWSFGKREPTCNLLNLASRGNDGIERPVDSQNFDRR
jgi:hypothetical protein